VLALLFLEASYLEVRRGERPVILLDDIFSELDANHRERVLTAFSDHQVFLTATDMPTGEAFPGIVRMVEKGALYLPHA
jgi:recombinational DNA repair ATPase RecF